MEILHPNNIDSVKLSIISKKRYKDCINHLASTLFKGDYVQLVQNPNPVYNHLRGKYKDAYATIGSFITAVNKLLDVSPSFSLSPAKLALWRKYRKQMREARQALYSKNELTEKQASNIVGFHELKQKFCDLQTDPITHLKRTTHYQFVLFAVFLNIRPKRADLGNVYLGQTLTDIPKQYVNNGNYLVLTGYPRLVMNRYKTQERYKRIVEPLTSDLIKIIQDSLVKYPRTYLITQSRSPTQPYDLNNSYAQFVKRAFDYHFDGRSMSASLWRHVFVAENVDFVNTPNDVLMKNARLSGQSLTTQLLIYKNVNIPAKLKLKTEAEKRDPIICKASTAKSHITK